MKSEARPILTGRRHPGPRQNPYDRFLEVASLQSERPAVIGDQVVTYLDLVARVDGLRGRLSEAGVPSGTAVVVQLPRGADSIAANLAVLAHGCHFVPVAQDEQDSRVEHVLSGTGASARISHDATRQPTVERTAHAEASPTRPGAAYIMHTSGSTGLPKGAVIPVDALTNLLAWYGDELNAGPELRLAHLSRPSFDFSIPEVFLPLLHGGAIVVPERPIATSLLPVVEHLIAADVTALQLVPTVLSGFIRLLQSVPSLAENLNKLGTIVCNGESLPDALRQAVATRLPHVRLVNSYGPTEACVAVTWHHCSSAQSPQPNLIGAPAPNVDLYVLDEELRPVQHGQRGELVIGGAQVGTGYVDAEETRRAFVTLLGSSPADPPVYRTGDMVRVTEEGLVEFFGRRDRQVQLRGVRVELGEIESQVLGTRLCRAVRVVPVEGTGPGTASSLACFVTPETVAVDAIREQVQNLLPADRWPADYHAVASFPATANGKTDDVALARLAERPTPQADHYGRPPVTRLSSDLPPERALQEAVLVVAGRLPHPDEVLRASVEDSLVAIELQVAVAERGYSLPDDPVRHGDLTIATVARLLTPLESSARTLGRQASGSSPGMFRANVGGLLDEARSDGHDVVVLQSSLPDIDAAQVHEVLEGLLAEIDRRRHELTVALPAYTLSFATRRESDLRYDRSESGALAQHALKAVGAERTRHPMYSFALVGARAAELARVDWWSRGPFGDDSIFGFFSRVDARHVLLATRALAHIHRCEFLAGAPYMSFTDLEGIMTDTRGTRSVTTPVYTRDVPGTEHFEVAGADVNRIFEVAAPVIRTRSLGPCEASTLDSRAVEQIVGRALTTDPYALIRRDALQRARDLPLVKRQTTQGGRAELTSSNALRRESSHVVIDAGVGDGAAGNAAAVVELDEFPPAAELLHLAQELDEPTTAFIVETPESHPGARAYAIRWFNRRSESRICGHATLAATEWVTSNTGTPVIRWHSGIGVLRAARAGDRVQVEFPQTDLQPLDAPSTERIRALTGRVPAECLVAGDDHMAIFDSVADVLNFNPDPRDVEDLDCRGLIVSAQCIGDDIPSQRQEQYDIVSRFFAPSMALPEDEVCVSAHCALYPYWSQRLGVNQLRAWQASPRGGVLQLDSSQQGTLTVTASCARVDEPAAGR